MGYKAVVDGYVLDGLRMRYGKIMITELESAKRKALVIGNIFQKEIINTHFRSVIV